MANPLGEKHSKHENLKVFEKAFMCQPSGGDSGGRSSNVPHLPQKLSTRIPQKAHTGLWN
jgi:hypothetical protein